MRPAAVSADIGSADTKEELTEPLESTVDSELAELTDTWEYTPKYSFEKIPWAEAFRTYLQDALEDPESRLDSGAKFGLFSIDADDVPELVVSLGSAHIEPGYIVSEFFFLTEIQVEQYYKTKELLGSHVTLQGTVNSARNRYHHSPFIFEPNLY